MKLPTIKKIAREDVKDAPNWILQIIEPVNSFMETVYQALNSNITFNQNIASFIREIVYNTPASYPSGVENIDFQNTLRIKATGLVVISAYERTTYIPAPGPVYAPWVETNGQIRIYPITGLEASKSYNIRFLVF